jgi:hypothetical protein
MIYNHNIKAISFTTTEGVLACKTRGFQWLSMPRGRVWQPTQSHRQQMLVADAAVTIVGEYPERSSRRTPSSHRFTWRKAKRRFDYEFTMQQPPCTHVFCLQYVTSL